MITQLFLVALGGALGAAGRFGLSLALARDGFPVAILCANVLGSFLMGAVFVWSQTRGLPYLTPLVMTGLLGGFTTFSAFSLEAYRLFEGGQAAAALVYVALSVLGALAALALGVTLAKGLAG